jgi:hypothetical protein
VDRRGNGAEHRLSWDGGGDGGCEGTSGCESQLGGIGEGGSPWEWM